MGDTEVQLPGRMGDFENIPEVKMKRNEAKLQECRSKIARWKLDIEDYKKKFIVDLEAKIMMAENEILVLEAEGRKLTVIEVEAEVTPE